MRSLLPIILLFLFGCTSAQYNLIPNAYQQKAKRLASGRTNVIICQGKNSDVMLFGYRDQSEIFIFSCIINKTDDKNLDIRPEKIKAFGINKTKQTMRLPIYSAHDYMMKKKNEKQQAQFSIAICSALNLMKAVRAKSYERQYASLTAHTDGSIFSINDDRKDALAFYTYGKTNDAQPMFGSERNSRSRAENQLYNNILLKKNTIPPNSHLEAVIIIDGKGDYHKKYVMIFPVGTDMHKIIFNPAMTKN